MRRTRKGSEMQAAAVLDAQREHPLFFFGRSPRYDRNYSGREPTSLYERIKAIAQAEAGAPADESKLSINETRVWLMTWGADLHEWMQRNEEAVMNAARSEALYPQQALLKLLDEALAAREAAAKKPPKK